jgi:hypothetical protein
MGRGCQPRDWVRGSGEGFPFDAAAGAGALVVKGRLAGDLGGEGGAEVFAGDGFLVAGAGVVELTGVGQAEGAVEEVEIGGAGGGVGFGDGLVGIEEVGEGPVVGGCERGHFVGGIGGVVFDVVGVDGDDTDASGVAFGGERGEGVGEMDDEGAVVADEHDEEAIGAAGVIEGEDGAGGVGEFEFGCGGAQGEDVSGGGFGHGD